MITSPREFFPSQAEIVTERGLLFKDIEQLETMIQQALDQARNPVVGNIRYADNFVEIKFHTPVALINTPLLPRYLKFITEDLRTSCRTHGWDDLTMSITFLSTSDENPIYEFCIKLTYR